MGQDVLTKLLANLPKQEDKNMLVGFESSDDAAVYLLNPEQAVIQTMDFFPPVVDDPYVFGAVAAANALSDIYAMGGVPVMAMNLLTFPSCLDPVCVERILQGGYSKVMEAGAVIGGGHTIEDTEPKYGLAVMGLIHPDRIWRNNTALPGDVLILTKPIGLGIYSLADRAELLSPQEEEEMIRWMTLLNRKGKECAEGLKVHACTDVTGFGLLGHMYEMADGSGVTIRLKAHEIPYLDNAVSMAADGFVPSGAYQNAEYIDGKVMVEEGVSQAMMDCLLDPQTSGGLVLSLPEEDGEEYLVRMHAAGEKAWKIGEVISKEDKQVHVC